MARHRIRETTGNIVSINKDGTVNMFIDGAFHPAVPTRRAKQGSVKVAILDGGQVKVLE